MSHVSLGWPSVLVALGDRTRTPMGARAAANLVLFGNATAVRAGYTLVAEIQGLGFRNESVPVGEVPDIGPHVDAAGRGVVLPNEELRRVGAGTDALRRLRRWVEPRADTAPHLARLSGAIEVNEDLVEQLRTSFDAAGELSEDTYPELGQLRRRIQALDTRIRATLDEMLRDPAVVERLQDVYVTERNGRFVLPVKANARRGFGISHGTSQSGETVFVEPTVIVELDNDRREAEAALVREEHHIRTVLSQAIGAHALALLASLEIATEVDLWCARERLGSDLDGMVPTVGTEGVLVARAARHPLLALAGPVVPNELGLSSATPALVLTGPNAGGKTVALKTLGLLALMVRACIPIPARDPTRVDLFDPILAEIGDRQSVEEGLSTFSAHLLAMKQALDAARPGALVLIDEIAVGTDPAQGAALARALTEALLDRGARVAVTTHFPEFKAITDRRFTIAAAQFEDGRPTFRLVTGAPGASMPLAVARRLGLPESVLERAVAVLDDSARELGERLEKLDTEIARHRREREQWEGRSAALTEREEALQARERRLEERARADLDAASARFRERLKEREEEVRQLVADLQANPGLKRANEVLRAVREQAEPTPEPAPEPAIPSFVVGDRVRLQGIGTIGTVRTRSGSRVEVEMGSVRTWVEGRLLQPVGAGEARREGRKERAKEQPPEPPADRFDGAVVRVEANTCDVRGFRVDEAVDRVGAFLDSQSRSGFRVCYILHGHGTGALKAALRAWLGTAPSVRRWRPADGTEGGDAFTVVEVR